MKFYFYCLTPDLFSVLIIGTGIADIIKPTSVYDL